MTSAVYRNGTPSLSIPQTQNTAPVLEFNCLYTHDLRRKAKRWQDGFLRYHTFNRRIMVYDVPRNFVGDVHWTAGEALQDGDEVMLEKDGVMVQVSEAVGQTETDLTGLLNSRKRVGSERGSSPPARGPQTPAARTVDASMARPPTQLKHRSLNALLGTPKGPIGKAAMSKSPFELRHDEVENHGWEGGRPPKRQRIDEPPARNISEPTIQLTRVRTAEAAKKKTRVSRPSAQAPKAEEVIDLRDDEPQPERFLPGFSSNALPPLPSPPRERPAARKVIPAARSSSPGFQTQQESKSKHHVATRPMEQSSREAEASHGDSATVQRTGNEQLPACKAGATLRVLSGPRKKNMLLCQDQLTSKPKRVSSTDTNDAADSLLGAAVDESGDELPETKKRSQRQLLDERLARIDAKKRKSETEKTASHAPPTDQTMKANVCHSKGNEAPESHAQHRALEDSALELAELDATITAPKSAADGSAVLSAPPVTETATLAFEAECAAPPNVKSTSPRKKKGVGRREIRASALSCFLEPPLRLQDTAAEVAASATIVEGLSTDQESQLMLVKARPVQLSPKEHLPSFSRASSETEQKAVTKPKRTPGAPMRFTPSPQKRTAALDTTLQANRAPGNVARPPATSKPAVKPKTTNQGKKAPQPALRLDTAASGSAAVMLGRPFQPLRSASKSRSPRSAEAVEAKPDPWSREAFDLFAWRPPGWDEERWCVKEVAEAVEEVARGAG
ncbi:hypothetical protein LTR01_003640 [Friedmanniomyces endolithicus]|nr:hypothetical protein LTR01_003640 [Friedmanniomyces endolithicus]KAK0835875.1 hypothetical protein LTR73_000376 [Friedmanniomyces endolithicus]